MSRYVDPPVHAAMLAAEWAQQIGLPAGNYWEPAIARHVLTEWRRLGADAQAWAFVEALYRNRLNLPAPVAEAVRLHKPSPHPTKGR